MTPTLDHGALPVLLALERAARRRVRLVEASGRPAVGVTVRVIAPESPAADLPLVTSDARGEFEVEFPGDEGATLLASSDEYESRRRRVHPSGRSGIVELTVERRD